MPPSIETHKAGLRGVVIWVSRHPHMCRSLRALYADTIYRKKCLPAGVSGRQPVFGAAQKAAGPGTAHGPPTVHL